jgi:hypothetical protein
VTCPFTLMFRLSLLDLHSLCTLSPFSSKMLVKVLRNHFMRLLCLQRLYTFWGFSVASLRKFLRRSCEVALCDFSAYSGCTPSGDFQSLRSENSSEGLAKSLCATSPLTAAVHLLGIFSRFAQKIPQKVLRNHPVIPHPTSILVTHLFSMKLLKEVI